MNILILTKKFPYPAKDGETIAIMQIIKGLAAAGHAITALCINTKKHFSDTSQLPQEIKQIADFNAVFVNTDPEPVKALRNLFSSKSYHYERFYSREFEKRLIFILQQKQFDIVQLEGLYMMLYADIIRKYSKAKIALRAHNIEYEVWERTVAQMSAGLKRFYLKLQTERLKQFELKQVKRCDAIVAISEADKEKLKKIAPAIPSIALPVGIDTEAQLPITQPEPFSVVHLGGMDWLPNQEGVKWFLELVWKKILLQLPEAKFYLAGRNIPDSFHQMKIQNFIIDGEVENARQYLASKSVVIVPLLSGSGIRVKIIENMAWGKCIVSTTIGAEGIGATHNENILLADTPDDFADAVCKALSSAELQRKIGGNAFNFARQQFDNNILTRQLTGFYEKIMASC
jgi:polysaccharide biosynthesis protein PslH